MVDTRFPRRGKMAPDDPEATPTAEVDQSGVDPVTEAKSKEDKPEEIRKPRVILSHEAIVPSSWVIRSAVKPDDGDGAHHVCQVGDVVGMTDAEFAAHREGGVCIVDEAARDAA